MADHAATVATIYEAFGRGDVDAILEHLADDVEWEAGIRDTGLDYLRERHGKQEVTGFFAALMANVSLTHFEPLALCAAGDYVTVPVRHAGSIVGGGEVPMTTEVHVWRFGPDGKVVSFQHVFDYAIHERAAAERCRAVDGPYVAGARRHGPRRRRRRPGGGLRGERASRGRVHRRTRTRGTRCTSASTATSRSRSATSVSTCGPAMSCVRPVAPCTPTGS